MLVLRSKDFSPFHEWHLLVSRWLIFFLFNAVLISSTQEEALGAFGIFSPVVTVAITLTYEVMTPVAAVIIGSYDFISQV